MQTTHFEYRTEHFDAPPSGQDLACFARDGWRLVSVTVDLAVEGSANAGYVAYLERPANLASTTLAAPLPLVDTDAKPKSTLRVVAGR